MQVDSSASPLLTIDEVEKIQRDRIASFTTDLVEAKRECIIWQKRVEQLVEYFLCEKEMHEAYANGDELSYVPDRCNIASIHHPRCKTMSSIFGDTDCKEGDCYTLLIDQVAKLKEENELLDIKCRAWKRNESDRLARKEHSKKLQEVFKELHEIIQVSQYEQKSLFHVVLNCYESCL